MESNPMFQQYEISGVIRDSHDEAPDHEASTIFCPRCEAPCMMRKLPDGTLLRCKRCGARVQLGHSRETLQPALAFATAGLFSALLANLNPILLFDVAGRTQTGRIITGVNELFLQGYWPLALLVFFAAILAPITYMISIWYVSLACCLRLRLPFIRQFLAVIEAMEPWNLVPVFSIATVVAVVKLRMLGTVEWEFGARWILGFSLFSLLTSQFFDVRLAEKQIKETLNKSNEYN